MARASGLGKGLSALISERKTTISEIAENTGKKGNLLISDVFPGRFQPRTIFDDSELAELAESIKRNGVLQPILVKERAGKGFEIIAGERRWRASKQAGIADIPGIILDIDDRQAMEIALIENIQRENLKVLEEAGGYKKLIKEFDYTQEQLADVIGKSRSYVTNVLRLTALPDEVKDLLNEGKISTGHARAILTAPDIIDAANQIIKKNLSVRQTETLVKKLSVAEGGEVIRKKSYSRKKKNDITELDSFEEIESNPMELETDLSAFEGVMSEGSASEDVGSFDSSFDNDSMAGQEKPSGEFCTQKDEEIILLEQEMSRIFGFKVEINNRDEDGEVIIKYSSMEELNSILNKIEGSPSDE